MFIYSSFLFRSSRATRIPGTLSNVRACEGDLIVACPLCRKLTHLPPDGVTGLANNLTVMCLLQLLPPGANPAMLAGKRINTGLLSLII